jgi:hypothetical protein
MMTKNYNILINERRTETVSAKFRIPAKPTQALVWMIK